MKKSGYLPGYQVFFLPNHLNTSLYQIIFLTKIPNSAAVNEGVALAKKYANPRAAGFLNAVLRKAVAATENEKLPEIGGSLHKRLSIKYSHPEWLVRELCERLADADAESLLAVSNAPDTPVTVQINTLLAGADEVLSGLISAGIDARRHDWLESCITMHSAGSVTGLDEFKRGRIYVQDVASRLVIEAAAPKPGDIVIDGCAAPGGKSFAAAIAMNNTGNVLSRDKNTAKLRLIEEGASRMGISIIKTEERDASSKAEDSALLGDIVLADVPCSGFGVIRKKPDIRYKSEKDVSSLPEIQKSILKGLSSYVKAGGLLLYSTCTFLKSENEDVVEWFLKEHRDFTLECFFIPGAGDVPAGMITLWPHVHGTDGFFICKLRKAGG